MQDNIIGQCSLRYGSMAAAQTRQTQSNNAVAGQSNVAQPQQNVVCALSCCVVPGNSLHQNDLHNSGTNGGNAVEVEGSFDNWTTRHSLQRSGKDFTLVKLLAPGVYQVSCRLPSSVFLNAAFRQIWVSQTTFVWGCCAKRLCDMS